MTGRRVDSILVVDSNSYGRLDARLARVLRGLGAHREKSSGFSSVRDEHARFHDLDAYDLAIVHESDALKDGGAFMERCWGGTIPCVVFSGGIERGSKESDRLLRVPDTDLIAHAEEGVSFLERYGLLHLTAWTRGVGPAVRAEVVATCGKIRVPFLALRDAGGPTAPNLVELAHHLRQWFDSPSALSRIDLLERLLDEASAVPASGSLQHIRTIFHTIDEIIQLV